jgi:tRNA threonylcarbamoyladenosine biosynthesis protein TsaE
MSASSEPAGPLRTSSAEETEALGAELAGRLSPGDLVLVEGDLGAGKTTLVRGAVHALGHTGRVTSPTFTIAARYEDGRVPVSHLDLYRLRDAGADAEDLILLEDEMTPDRVVFVEWPDTLVLSELVPGRSAAWRVALRHAGADTREVEIRPGDGA